MPACSASIVPSSNMQAESNVCQAVAQWKQLEGRESQSITFSLRAIDGNIPFNIKVQERKGQDNVLTTFRSRFSLAILELFR